ncbi:glycine cleavage system protein H (lipoyl acceptor protein) [Ruminococcaceae bacterium BL-6]|nr:glycine cleavage system protein H (lipoyl acceptor protein) [Ruminococcaceae bacterium BL-6]
MSGTKGMRFTKEHEWVKCEEGKVYIGITDYAQKELGDIVFVELPEVGRELESGDMICTVESVKTVSDVYTPLNGQVVEVNSGLMENPGLINKDPYGSFIAVLQTSDPSVLEKLMDEAAYKKFCEEEK